MKRVVVVGLVAPAGALMWALTAGAGHPGHGVPTYGNTTSGSYVSRSAASGATSPTRAPLSGSKRSTPSKPCSTPVPVKSSPTPVKTSTASAGPPVPASPSTPTSAPAPAIGTKTAVIVTGLAAPVLTPPSGGVGAALAITGVPASEQALIGGGLLAAGTALAVAGRKRRAS